MSVAAIILAAGKGTRMKSDLPKPLHQASGRSLLGWVVEALRPARFGAVSIVIGHGGDLVQAELAEGIPDREFLYATQMSQRGTGDAAAVGLNELDLSEPSFSDDDHVVVLPGDTPLLTADTVERLVDQHIQTGAAGTVVTARVDDPTGYGRIVRGPKGSVQAIVEHRDASAEQLRVDEINGGMYCFRRSLLAPALRMISTDNAQGELYLTDVVSVLVEAGHPVEAFVTDPVEISGVNDRAQLAAAAGALDDRIRSAHMRDGVSLLQPGSILIGAEVVIEPDTTIHAGSVLEGRTTVAAGAVIGPHTHLVDAQIGADAVVPNSVVDGAVVADGQSVAPFSHLR
ncbi:MAG: NTP transferase domain-containing protein [Actinomycetota bacterium]